MESKRKVVEDNLQKIIEWEKQRLPLVEVARRLQMKYDTLKKYLKVFNIAYKCNPNRKGLPHPEGRKSLEEILSGNTTNSRKRIALIESGVREEKCDCCGLSTWMGKPIPLELHHKDFNHYNNTLSNLQILCANCHMQAHNYCNTRK